MIDWRRYFSENAEPMLNKVIFLEENRLVGSLANAVIAEEIAHGRPLPAIDIACVRHAEFEALALRPSALKANRLDANSIVETVRKMCK